VDAVGFPDNPGIINEEGDVDGITVKGWHGACIDSQGFYTRSRSGVHSPHICYFPVAQSGESAGGTVTSWLLSLLLPLQ